MIFTTRLARTALLGFALVTLTAEAQAPLDVRVALVIGNAAYVSVRALKNSVNDAKSMSETLRKLGFNVIELRDGSKAQMTAAIAKLREALKGKLGVGLLYYAGHGLQIDARNYMVPVDAKIGKAGDVAAQTVNVSEVLDVFKASGNRMNIVVLDACRDNPFGGIISGKGLAPLDAPTSTFLAYATAPGNVAADGDANSGNGLYTQYLLQEITKPQARIEDVFKRVRFSVRQASNGKQIPWESTSLEEDFLFNDGKVVPAIKPTLESLRADFDEEKKVWDQIKNSSKVDDFYAFLKKYPNGVITEAAHARLNQLSIPTLSVQGAGADGGNLSMQRERFRVGDQYSIKMVTEGRVKANMLYTSKVSSIVDSEVVVETIIDMGAQLGKSQTKEYFTAEGAYKGNSFNGRFDPPQFDAPAGQLQVGQVWRIAVQVANKDVTVSSAGEGRVISREKIAIAAGTFDTFKISRELKNSKGEITNCTDWMTPSFPIQIKMECKDSNGGGFSRELLSYIRGPAT
jgi:hypothetical protein